MPSAVVVVNDELKIIECNANFVRLFSDDIEEAKDLEGLALDSVISFSRLFRRVLDGGEDIVSHDIRYQRSILNSSIFAIEPHSVLCGIFRTSLSRSFRKSRSSRARAR